MIVTQVTVSIHEKRNHPHVHAHYDASVSLTAEVGVLEYGDAIRHLRDVARAHVQEECDDWIAGIEEQRRIDDLGDHIGSALDRLKWSSESLRHAKQALRHIHQLPEDLQEPWREKLRQALAQARADRQARAREPLGDLDEEDEPPF